MKRDNIRQAFEARIKTLGDEARAAYESSGEATTTKQRDDLLQRARALCVTAQEIRAVLNADADTF